MKFKDLVTPVNVPDRIMRALSEYERIVLTLRALGCPERKAALIVDYCILVGQQSINKAEWHRLATQCCLKLQGGESASEVYNWIADQRINR